MAIAFLMPETQRWMGYRFFVKQMDLLELFFWLLGEKADRS